MTTFTEMDQKLTDLENSEGDPVLGNISEVLIHQSPPDSPVSAPALTYNGSIRGTFNRKPNGKLVFVDKDNRDITVFKQTEGLVTVPLVPKTVVAGTRTNWGWIEGGTLDSTPYGNTASINEGQSGYWADGKSHDYNRIELSYTTAGVTDGRLTVTFNDQPWSHNPKKKNSNMALLTQIGDFTFVFNPTAPVAGKAVLSFDQYSVGVIPELKTSDSVTLGLVDITDVPEWKMKIGYEYIGGQHRYGMVGDSTIDGKAVTNVIPHISIASNWNHHKPFPIKAIFAVREGFDLYLQVDIECEHLLHVNAGTALKVRLGSHEFILYSMYNDVGTSLRCNLSKSQFAMWTEIGSTKDLSVLFLYKTGSSSEVFSEGEASWYNKEGKVVGQNVMQPISVVNTTAEVAYAKGLLSTDAETATFVNSSIHTNAGIRHSPSTGGTFTKVGIKKISVGIGGTQWLLRDNITDDWVFEATLSGWDSSVPIAFRTVDDDQEILYVARYVNTTANRVGVHTQLANNWPYDTMLDSVSLGDPLTADHTPAEYALLYSKLKITRRGNLLLIVSSDCVKGQAEAEKLPYLEHLAWIFDLTTVSNWGAFKESSYTGFGLNTIGAVAVIKQFQVPAAYVYDRSTELIHSHDVNVNRWDSGTVGKLLPKGVLFKDYSTGSVYRSTNDGLLEEVKA